MEDAHALENLNPEALNGTNELRLYVFANEVNGLAVVMGLLET